MPVHDWTRVDAGLFHHFHQQWIGNLCDGLNTRALPPDFFALVEQNIRRPIPDVLTLKLSSDPDEPTGESNGSVAVATAPPRTRVTRKTEADAYLTKTNRITVRHRHGKIIAVIEIVSPGNKGSQSEFRKFIEKSADLVMQGVHLLVIDLFPPGPCDPDGIAKAIWDEFVVEDFEAFPDMPLSLVAIDAGSCRTIYYEPIGVGDTLPDMPLFLRPEAHVPAPLEETCAITWKLFPAPLKKLLENT